MPNQSGSSKSGEIESVFETFTRKKWILFFISLIVFVVTAFTLLYTLNERLLVGVPAHGGVHTEGVVGTPRFINPLLALSDADKDLTSLVYSGLMRRDPNGNLIPDLAQSYTVSPDGLTYTFVLKNNAYFQDNKKVTAADVVYTINAAKDPAIKSPKSHCNCNRQYNCRVYIEATLCFIPRQRNHRHTSCTSLAESEL